MTAAGCFLVVPFGGRRRKRERLVTVVEYVFTSVLQPEKAQYIHRSICILEWSVTGYQEETMFPFALFLRLPVPLLKQSQNTSVISWWHLLMCFLPNIIFSPRLGSSHIHPLLSVETCNGLTLVFPCDNTAIHLDRVVWDGCLGRDDFTHSLLSSRNTGKIKYMILGILVALVKN